MTEVVFKKTKRLTFKFKTVARSSFTNLILFLFYFLWPNASTNQKHISLHPQSSANIFGEIKRHFEFKPAILFFQEEYDAAILIMHSSLNPSHNSSLVLNSTLSTSLYLNNSVDPRFSLLRQCSLKKELDSAAGGTGLAFIVMAEVFTQVNKEIYPPLFINSCLEGLLPLKLKGNPSFDKMGKE